MPARAAAARSRSNRGIEMGHIFKLGTRLHARRWRRPSSTRRQPAAGIMGCYGIGASRLLQCVDRGEPRRARHHLAGRASRPTTCTSSASASIAGDSAEQGRGAVRRAARRRPRRPLRRPRASSAGVKFNDADLLGMPVRVTVSPRSLEKGAVEMKLRSGGDAGARPLRRRRRAHPARSSPADERAPCPLDSTSSSSIATASS